MLKTEGSTKEKTMKTAGIYKKGKFPFVITFTMFLVLPVLAENGTSQFDQGMQPILEQYLKIHKALSEDSTKGVQTAAKSIAQATAKLDAKSVTGEHASHYKNLPAKIKKAAVALSKASDIKKARETFKELSRPMAMWGTMSKPQGIDVVFCSMAKGSWLQKEGKVLNPYYGKSMLHCGEVVGGASHEKNASNHRG